MPYLDLSTNASITPHQEEVLYTALSDAISALRIPRNSGDWLMCQIHDAGRMRFQKVPEQEIVYVEVKTLGEELSDYYPLLTENLSHVITETLHIPSDHIYINYWATRHWGWNGNNF